MIVSARELVGALKATKMFASPDETRTHMNCVHVEAVGSALRLVSTDGHTLWCCEIPARDSAADPPPAHQTPWNIGLADVDTIVRSLKDASEVELLAAKRTVGGVEYAQHAADFARYAVVIPSVASTVPGKIPPQFAADYVSRCCQALAFYGKGMAPDLPTKGSKYEKEMARALRDQFVTPPIAWRVGGELDPALFYSPKFPAAVALVMPRRGEHTTAVVIEDFIDRVRAKASTKAA